METGWNKDWQLIKDPHKPVEHTIVVSEHILNICILELFNNCLF